MPPFPPRKAELGTDPARFSPHPGWVRVLSLFWSGCRLWGGGAKRCGIAHAGRQRGPSMPLLGQSRHFFGCFAPRHFCTRAFLGALHSAPSPLAALLPFSPCFVALIPPPPGTVSFFLSSTTLPGSSPRPRTGMQPQQQIRCEAGFAPYTCSGVKVPGFAPWAEEVPNKPSATGTAARLRSPTPRLPSVRKASQAHCHPMQRRPTLGDVAQSKRGSHEALRLPSPPTTTPRRVCRGS